jgi:hypothetical protein
MALMLSAPSPYGKPPPHMEDGELPRLDEVRQRIVELVREGRADERGGLVTTELTWTYQQQFGEKLEFRPYGYVKLSVLVSDMDEVVVDHCGPGSRSVMRLKGESFHPAPARGISVGIPRQVHEKSRLELMRSLERTSSSGSGGMHQLVVGDELENCVPENFERVHAGERSTQRAFASHRRKRLEREEQAALQREAYASSIVARVPSPVQREQEEEEEDDEDEQSDDAEDEPQAQLSLRAELELLRQAPPEPAEISVDALTWGWLQEVKLATGMKATGAWGALQRQHSTKDVRTVVEAAVRPGTLVGDGTDTCTLALWDGEEHCAVGAAELDPAGTAALMYWQVTVKGKPGSAVLGVLRAPCPDKENHEAEIARERRRIRFGAVPADRAVELSYRSEEEHRTDLPNMWPCVWSALWSVSDLHGPEWSKRYHLKFEDAHRAAAIKLQKGFRRYAPIIKAAKAAKKAIDAARPGGRYDPHFYGWGSNGAVYIGGRPPSAREDERATSKRNINGPWNVSRIAEGEVLLFKLERGKLSFQVPRTGASGSMPLPWEDLDGAEGAEERRKQLINMLMDAKKAEHEKAGQARADFERFTQDKDGNFTSTLTYAEDLRVKQARDEEQALADELRDMEMRAIMRRAASAGLADVVMPDEWRVCCDLTSECSVTLERVPPFDVREF